MHTYEVSMHGEINGNEVTLMAEVSAMNKDDAVRRAYRLCKFPILDVVYNTTANKVD